MFKIVARAADALVTRVAPKAAAQACRGYEVSCGCDQFTRIQYYMNCCGGQCGACYRRGTC
ncbi:hypothetical protein [Pseudonocardia sp. TRM90224]|uniref:hypothetical protein n=1 Tax=Pseudonocardia sp. TRM90224 TaxID=2812678 RepID=UPI001E4DAC36|nr:hypothetical protein [Pseudonocardia sp. TRM90224]